MDLAHGIELTGAVQTIGSATNRRQFCNLTFIPQDGEETNATSAQCDPEGKIVVRALLPGRYQVSIVAMQAYVQSATSGNTDLLKRGVLVVGPGSAPQALEIVLNTDGGRLAGTVAALDMVAVLMVPSSGGEPLIAGAFNGRFQAGPMAPGDYQVYLLRDANAVEYRNPAVLQTLGHGQAVQVTQGATTTVDLKEVAK